MLTLGICLVAGGTFLTRLVWGNSFWGGGCNYLKTSNLQSYLLAFSGFLCRIIYSISADFIRFVCSFPALVFAFFCSTFLSFFSSVSQSFSSAICIIFSAIQSFISYLSKLYCCVAQRCWRELPYSGLFIGRVFHVVFQRAFALAFWLYAVLGRGLFASKQLLRNAESLRLCCVLAAIYKVVEDNSWWYNNSCKIWGIRYKV